MAMTTCKECKAQISTTADSCPQCGAKRKKTSGCAIIVAGFFGLIAFSALARSCAGNSSIEAPAPTPAKTTAAPAPAAPPPAPAIGSQWSYHQDVDPMGKGTTYYAQVTSSNTVSFSFPYNEEQHGSLTLRTHPRYGKDVILGIERGQFLCRSYEDCNVLVRFDDQNAVTYSAVGASDNSTETIFLRNYPRFLASMLKAKRVRISAEVFQEGNPVFEFDVTGFDAGKYKPK